MYFLDRRNFITLRKIARHCMLKLVSSSKCTSTGFSTSNFTPSSSIVVTLEVKKMMKFFRDRKPQGASNDDPYHIPENLAVFDPFKFWAEQNGENLKAIRHMPMILLSIPATSAPSERAFSSAGYIVDKNRNRLLETNVTMLTVVRDHLIRCKSSMQSVH